MRPEDLRERRIRARLTIKRLSELSGISRRTISEIENGRREGSAITLGRLEDALSEARPCQELLDALKRLLSVMDSAGAERWNWLDTDAYEAHQDALRAIEKAESGASR